MDPLASSNGANSRNSSFTRRNEGYGHRCRSLFNIGVWILNELVVILCLIASIVVFSLSRHEKYPALWFVWVIGYASGCVATFPFLYWSFLHRNRGTEDGSTQTCQDASRNYPPPEPSTFVAITVSQSTDEEDRQTTVSSARSAESARASARVKLLVKCSRLLLILFFEVWTLVGNIWVSRGYFYAAAAPDLYRFCLSFLKDCCLWYGLISGVYEMIDCCFQNHPNHTRGAATEIIVVLPTYKFKLKDRNGDNRATNSGVGERGGTLGAGTEKERIISGEDAECSICLEKYADNEELKELPCTHFFHVRCIDKWLKKNASCPLCKRAIGKPNGNLHTSAIDPNQPSAPE